MSTSLKPLSSILQAFLCFCVMIISGCTSVPDLKNDNEVKEYLSDNKLYIEGDCTFDQVGNFKIVPASPNDRTQLYKGVYTLGKFEEDGTREIDLRFSNSGDITDGHTFNGTNFKGVGRHLHGWLYVSKYLSKLKGSIEFDDNDPAGWVVGDDGATKINTKTSASYDFEPK